MKTRYYFLTLLMAILGMSAEAQQRNVLQVPDVATQVGKAQLPVSIENTDEIVGAQFDLLLPDGIIVEEYGSVSNRSDGHIVTVSHLSNGAYRVLLHTGANRPLRGQSGVVMYLSLNIPSSFEEGTEHPFSVSNAVLGKASGENVLTEATAGKIRISKLPDLSVKSIAVDKQEFNPGERIVCSWQVENIGELATEGGWSEQISLVSENSTHSKVIATTYYESVLSAGGIVSRQAEVVLPDLPGIDGQVRLQVRIIPDNNAGEPTSAQGNNTLTGEDVVRVNKLLKMELLPNRVDENSGKQIALKVSRSGNWTKAETFTIASTTDSRVSVPTSIVIPANQSGAVVYFTVVDNDVLDDASAVNIMVTGNDYPEATAMFTIDDNELPSLSITPSKTDIKEGETFQITIKTNRASLQPIAVTLTSENARRFKFPSQVTIPAGELSAITDVIVTDNDEIEQQESVSFFASAERHERGECIIMLSDNDMPTLTFTLSPEAVSEADGYSALLGIIKRTDNLDKRVTLKLSDDSNGQLIYSNKTIYMEKNQAEVQFNIGVTDNSLVDGNHQVMVTAAVYASSCNCSVQDDTKGSMTAAITIIDDDGPSLKIKPAGTAMLEGSEGNVFTISHNIQPNKDVRVSISSDRDEMLEYSHELTIPAGQSSTNLLVKVKNNAQQDDSSITSFKVEADGYAMGTCWIMITDQTLPDAIVSLNTDKTETEAQQTVLLHAVVKNVGNTILPSYTPLEISFSGRKETVKLTVGKSLAPGESTTIEYNYDLPTTIGEHTFYATVNGTRKVSELVYANNASEKVGLTILSPFTVTAKTDKDLYTHGENIQITGAATGSAGKNANVEVYIINEGIRQKITAKTDESGNYHVTWMPQARQMGHFIIGACYPDAGNIDEMSHFDVYGLRTSKKFDSCEMGLSETYNGKIVINNPGLYGQTGIKVTPMAVSANCDFNFSAPATVGSDKEIEVNYTIKANAITEGRDWQQMPLEISTTEGSLLNYVIYYYVQPQHASLQTNITSINTTMTMGAPHEYPIVIRNIGKSETGIITLNMADWIETSTSRELTSLAQGDSVTVVLRFKPTSDMKLNLGISGQIGINCENGNGTTVGYSVTPVSEAAGLLNVDVVDEYSFFTEEAPHVAGAKVRVKHPSTGAIVAEGNTGTDGIFTASIPEGWYTITVDADKHNSYSNTLIINPGKENNEEVFLSYQAITYSWDVVETEIEDEYEVETIVKYETRVPKPVVIITLPDDNPEPNSIIPVILTNQGLVSAVDVNLSLSINNDYTLEFLNDPSLEVLAPQQSHVFYAKMVPTNATGDETGARAQTRASSSHCYTLIARAVYKELCKKYTGTELAEAIKKWGTRGCYSTGGIGGSGYGGYGGYGGGTGPGSPSVWRGGTTYGDYILIDDLDDPTKFCDKVNDDDEEKPEETDDCDEEPTYVFKMKDYTTGNPRKGVATDGLSKVKIVISSESKIPSEECGVSYRWGLSEEIGTLVEKDSWEKVVYTGPENYPSESGSTYNLKATLYYTKDGVEKIAYETDIELVRPPVLFVHGLHDKGATWNKMIKYLSKEKLYSNFQLLAANYEGTHNETFATNVGVVEQYAKNLLGLVNRNGYTATKVDAVGHSMGGLLTKKCIQERDGGEFIRKVITLNTPHGGSQLGNFLNDSRVKFVRDVEDMYIDNWAWYLNPTLPRKINITPHPISRSILKFIYKEFGPNSGNISNGAVSDLSVGGSAISLINNNSTRSVKCHAITTTTKSLARTLLDNVFAAFEYPSGDDFLKELYNGDESDLIVPLKSQKGGLESPYVSSFSAGWALNSWNYFHSNTCTTENIMKEVRNLLSSNINGSDFADGFNYSGDMEYFMPTLDNVNKIYTEQNSILTNRNNSRVSLRSRRAGNTNEQDLSLSYDYNEGDSIVSVKVNHSGEYSYIGFAGFHKNQLLGYVSSDQGLLNLPNKINDNVIIMYEGRTIGGEWYSESDTIRFNTIGSVQLSQIDFELDTLYAFNDVYTVPQVYAIWSDGSQSEIIDATLSIENDSIATIGEGNKLYGWKSGATTLVANYQGLSCRIPVVVNMFNNDIEDEEDSDDSPSICSTVTLSFKQKMVMTRQAFRGTLTVNNGNETTAMKNVKMTLEVRDMDGNLTTSHEFQIDAESLDGFEGNLDFVSGWTLGSGKTGVATILFIPTKYAAPTDPKDYSFGGSFSYTDPYTGMTVTRNLNPVTLTVKPSPNLEMTYFMQRDVFGDDPLTEDVEPMAPSEFALLINNKGYGDAVNLNLATQQPEIIDNQKNLVINFEILSSQLNGGEKTLALGTSTTSDFGTIPALSQSYAQWWLQSSLLGHFIEYDVKATHVSSRDNPDLTLLDTVTIHELIHGFTVSTEGDKPLRGFLVNDIKDEDDMPDVVYFTDATQQSAYMASGADIAKQSDTEFVLTISADHAGWNYGSLLDPTFGKQKLVRVLRSDGTEVNIDNIWQTDRTLRDGKDPLYENRLHFVGNMSANGEKFNLTFEPRPEVELEVVSIGGIPESGKLAVTPVDEITVRFTKEINPETFTTDDVTLAVQGVKQDVSRIVISSTDNQSFTLNLSALNGQLGNGYYTLTVQTADITDSEGFKGKVGKQVGWIMFRDGKVKMLTAAYPEKSGTIMRKLAAGTRGSVPSNNDANSADYGSEVILTATPTTGYEFVNWTMNGEVVSTEDEFVTTALGDMDVVANFRKKTYKVDIVTDDKNGIITGAGTGFYEHGTVIELEAVPATDYMFGNWNVNGGIVDGTGNKLSLSVDKPFSVGAAFIQEYYHQAVRLSKGWNWVSAYLNEPLSISDFGEFVNRIIGQTDELINDPQYGLVGDIKEISAGKAYKIESEYQFSNSLRGHLYDTESSPISLHKGWNWMAYPYYIQGLLSETIANPEDGDVIVSQTGYSEYADGSWEGSFNMLVPGQGYLYKSVRDKQLRFNFLNASNGSRRFGVRAPEATDVEVDIHKYPNTMNVTARIIRDGEALSPSDYIIYAMAGKELRGISKHVGKNQYLTVYGEKPVEITLLIEDMTTGESFVVSDPLLFTNDVVGSRKSPLLLNIGDIVGIETMVIDSRPMTVYNLQGVLIYRDATIKSLRNLPKGIYIINGRKCFIK